MNNKHLKQLVVTLFFMLACMALPANGNLVTAIQPDVFIEQAMQLKAQAVGVTRWGLTWNLSQGDKRVATMYLSIHPTPDAARRTFEAYWRSFPSGIRFLQDEEGPGGPGEKHVFQRSRLSFVRNNVFIIIHLGESNDPESTDKQLLEKAGLIDKALQQEKGAPGVTRGDKVDAVIIEEGIYGSDKVGWKVKAHRESAPNVQAQGKWVQRVMVEVKHVFSPRMIACLR